GRADVAMALRRDGKGRPSGRAAGDPSCQCTDRNQPSRISWAIPRASLRSVFTGMVRNAARSKSLPSQEIRALLTGRKLMQGKLQDVERSLRGILRGFGLKVGKTTPRTFEGRILELVAGQPVLQEVADALLAARAVLAREFRSLDQRIHKTARQDERVRLLM